MESESDNEQQIVVKAYLISDLTLWYFRSGCAIISICLLVTNSLYLTEHYFWFLTNWGVIFTSLYFCLVTIMTNLPTTSLENQTFKQSKELCKFAIFLFESDWCLIVIITTGYWVSVYAFGVKKSHPGIFLPYFVHTIPFAFLYMTFNWYYSYRSSYQDSIYIGITWDNLPTFIAIFLGHILLLLCYFASYLFSVYKYKQLQNNRFIESKSQLNNLLCEQLTGHTTEA